MEIKMDSVVIGKFRISKSSDGKISIYIVNDGEGGEFDENKLAEVINKFYAENF